MDVIIGCSLTGAPHSAMTLHNTSVEWCNAESCLKFVWQTIWMSHWDTPCPKSLMQVQTCNAASLRSHPKCFENVWGSIQSAAQRGHYSTMEAQLQLVKAMARVVRGILDEAMAIECNGCMVSLPSLIQHECLMLSGEARIHFCLARALLLVDCVLTLVGQACVILLCVSIQATSYTVPATLCHNGLWSLQQYPDGSFWRLGSGMDCKWSGCVQTQPSAVLWGGKSASPSPLHLVIKEGEMTCPWTVGSFLHGDRSGCALGLLAKRRGYITWHDSLLERRYHFHPAWRLSPPIWCGVHSHTRNWTSDEAKK